MNISITGTRSGWTHQQRAYMMDVFRRQDITRLTHGGCVGVDQQCHYLFGRPECSEVWPSNDDQRAWAIKAANTVHPIKPPLERNRDIVRAGEIVYAFPKRYAEVLRSGTWATIRYARNIGKPHIIVWPDGTSTKGPHGHQP